MKRCLHVGLDHYIDKANQGVRYTCRECGVSTVVSRSYIRSYAEGVSPYPYELARTQMLEATQPSKRSIWAARHRKAVSKARMFAATRVR